MEDWKNRLKEEYAQTKERYEKLKKYNVQTEVECKVFPKAAEDMRDVVERELKKSQQRAMGEYLHILEMRAELAHIEL